MTKALITGVTGQDGSYLAELLLSKGYEVHGLARRSSKPDEQQKYVPSEVIIHYGDITDSNSLYQVVKEVMPDEVYHLAAQSFVKTSFTVPVATGDITGLGTMRMLEVLRQVKPDAKFYNAGSSEMFGASPAPQNEETPFHPVSPYSVAKVYAYWATRNYRESYDMFGVNGICFNHESSRRGIEFVSRKIAHGVAEITKGKSKELRLGNLEAKRDWGHAKDYVKAMWLTMQQPKAEDWVIGSGESHTVGEFVKLAFEIAGLDWEKYVMIDPAFYRPNEVNFLQADATKIKGLGWEMEYSFEDLVREMVNSELLED